jgi:hypothetical protein
MTNVDEMSHQNGNIHDLEKVMHWVLNSRQLSMSWSTKMENPHVLGAKFTTNVDELIHQNGKYRLGKVMYWVLNSQRMSMSWSTKMENPWLGEGHVLGAKLTTNVDELIHQNGKSMTWKGHVLGADLSRKLHLERRVDSVEWINDWQCKEIVWFRFTA